jgi:hypothetical protein
LQYPTSPEAIYPEEAITAHRAFISRRRTLRPSEEYRDLTPEEWDDFLGHVELRKVSLGVCTRDFGTRDRSPTTLDLAARSEPDYGESMTARGRPAPHGASSARDTRYAFQVLAAPTTIVLPKSDLVTVAHRR